MSPDHRWDRGYSFGQCFRCGTEKRSQSSGLHVLGRDLLTDLMFPRVLDDRRLLKLLEKDGWYVVRTRGSHRQLRHATKPGTVTVSGHPSDTVHPKTLKSVLRQAGLENLDV